MSYTHSSMWVPHAWGHVLCEWHVEIVLIQSLLAGVGGFGNELIKVKKESGY